MKKIKLLFASLALVAFTLSCDDDGGTSKIDLDNGGVPDINKVENETTENFINLNEIQEGNDITIGVTVGVGQGDVVSIDLTGFYTKASTGETEKNVFETGITTFPSTFTYSKADLLDAFDVLATDADFELGDALTFSATVTLGNGTVLNLINDDGSTNFGADVANSSQFSVVQTYNVSCPSDLGGTYEYITTNIGEPGGFTDAGPFTGTVTFTDTGGGVYDISDASFGGWIGLYGPDNIAEGVQLKDICNQIAYIGVDQFDEVFTFSNLVVNGNELSFHWENDYGEFGDTTLINPNGDWPPLTL